MRWLDKLVCYHVIIIVALANTSIIAYNYHFFFVVTCKIYTLSSFQIYSTVLYCIYGTIYIYM